jgi:O-antigen/teichoic acid export membrane protein
MDSRVTRIFQLLGKENVSFYENILFKRGFKILLIQALGLIIAFAANILLARLYGEQVYGIYSLVSSWCILLAVLALFGMDDTHLVQLPSWKLKGDYKKIRQQLGWSLGINGILIPVICSIFLFVLYFFRIPGISQYRDYFKYGLFLVLMLTIFNNMVCFLRGMDKVIYGEIVDKVLRPTFFIILLPVVYFLGKDDLVIECILAAAAGLFCCILCLLIKIRKIIQKVGEPGGEHESKRSLSSNFRYVLLNLMYFLATRMDLLLMGVFSSAAYVGHYNVALKLADIAYYPVAIINLSLPTMLSTVKHESGQEAAPRLLYRISKNSFLQCFSLSILFLATGNVILHLFGKEFGDALPVLIIFLISNLIIAFMGSADVFFIMEGREKLPVYGRLLSLGITILLAFYLIPEWSMMGEAVSMLFGDLLYCAMMEFFMFRYYRVLIHPFASGERWNGPDKNES